MKPYQLLNLPIIVRIKGYEACGLIEGIHRKPDESRVEIHTSISLITVGKIVHQVVNRTVHYDFSDHRVWINVPGNASLISPLFVEAKVVVGSKECPLQSCLEYRDTKRP